VASVAPLRGNASASSPMISAGAWRRPSVYQATAAFGWSVHADGTGCRSSNPASFFTNASFTVPVGPFRCFAMLHLGDALLVGVLGVVILVAVDEHHDVGVLLDRAGVAEVGQDRPLVVAGLDGAARAARAR
jgi:hypothetical protein